MEKADEMFKKLGYNKQNKVNLLIEYSNSETEINFWLEDKTISKNYEANEVAYITIEELKAINKKCIEMEWLKMEENKE